MFLSKYKNKKIFITGHTGFKGTWLTLILKSLGADICGYSLENNESPNLFEIVGIKDSIVNIYGDLRNEKFLEEVVTEFNPDIIFHLAAQPLVRLSYKNPKLTYETNVIGTLNLYEAARKCKNLKGIVSITTDKCYENKELDYGYKEEDPMGGYDPYSSSKGCVELLSSSYRRSFFESQGVLLATCRAGNVIGGGDFAEDRLIPDFVRAVVEDKTMIIRNPLAVRPWQHVLEPLTGYLMLGIKLLEGKKEFGEAWNFGPDENENLSVGSILDNCIKVWGKGSYALDKNENPHEAMTLKLDISKAKKYLNWKPKYSVTKAIEETIIWYKELYSGKMDMKKFTINQVEEYIKIKE